MTSKTVSLYSFKGGAGRTVSTANLAGIYANLIGASAEKPILLIDMDLDSAGLTIFLKQEDKFEDSPWSAAKIATGELDVTIRGMGDRLFAEGLVDVSEQVIAPPGSVLFMGAEVASRDGSALVEGEAARTLDDFLTFCIEKKNVSTVLIDSASGKQEVALLCHSVSNLIVYFCRLTNQFLTGTKTHIEHFVKECRKIPAEVPDFILVPVAVPQESERFKNALANAYVKLDVIANSIGESTNIEVLKPGIGEVESFKWYEDVLRRKRKNILSVDEINAIESYETLARKVASFLNND